MSTELPTPVSAPRSKDIDVEAAHKRKEQRTGWTTRLSNDVDVTYGYIPLLLYCLVSGLSDSVAFNAAGVFVSMQTGNTIFLALGASHLPAGQPVLWLKALVSIACFQAGAFVFSQFRHVGAQKKGIMFLSCFFQAIFVIVAAALAQGKVIPAFGDSRLGTVAVDPTRETQENDSIVLLPVALLAFQFGGQIYTSRVLGFSEVPTNVLTSLYCDLFSDPKLFAMPLGANPKRNRRIAAAVLTLIGGIAGGWLQRSRAGMSGALWIAAVIKLAISVSWLVWPSKAKPSS